MSGDLISLFLGSVLASTIVPGGVEVLLYFMVKDGIHQFHELLIVATLGNTLGGVITFYMGGLLHKGVDHVSRRAEISNHDRPAKTLMNPVAWIARIRATFKLEPSALARARRWGVPALLLSWMPIFGDPLCIAAGYLRFPFWPSFWAIAFGKFGRYLVLLWALSG